MKSQSGNSGCGCLGIIVFAILVWALCFGVTIGGRHYGMTCSSAHGVEIEGGK